MTDSIARATTRVIAAPGEIRSITSANPDPGGELAVTVPENEIWSVNAFRMQMTTDSTNTTRTVQFIIESPGGTELFRTEFAGKAQDETFTLEIAKYGFEPTDIDNRLRETLPLELYLPAGSIIKTSTENIQSGDQFSGAVFFAQVFESIPTA